LDLSIDELSDLVLKYEGILVPAHINKGSNSLLTNLGFIPPNLKFDYIEIFNQSPYPEALIETYGVLSNSDAHSLEKINEAEYFMDVESRSLESVIKYLKRKDK
jgi:PHP family Zn ribbon phosphoesterase